MVSNFTFTSQIVLSYNRPGSVLLENEPGVARRGSPARLRGQARRWPWLGRWRGSGRTRPAPDPAGLSRRHRRSRMRRRTWMRRGGWRAGRRPLRPECGRGGGRGGDERARDGEDGVAARLHLGAATMEWDGIGFGWLGCPEGGGSFSFFLFFCLDKWDGWMD